jgi:O-antigen ligase
MRIALFSLLSGVKMSFVGTLILSEVYAFINAISLKKVEELYWDIPDVKKIHAAFMVFLLIQIFSDAINHTAMNNMLRGWAAIVVSVGVITFMFRMFADSPKLILAFMVAEIVRLMVFGQSSIEQASNVLEDYSMFKFRIAPITNNIVLLLCYYLYNKRMDTMVIVLLVCYGLMSIGLDYRSNGLYFLISAMVMGFRNQLANMSVARKLGLTIVVIVGFQSVYMLYVNAVMSGEFGGKHAGEQLERMDNPYNPLGLILQGRGEFFVAIEAIKDRPFFGHGSWATDDDNHYRMMMMKEFTQSKVREYTTGNTSVIPSHSVLLGAWLYSGIIGFLAIFYIFNLSLKRAFFLIRDPYAMESPYYPIVIVFTVQLIWTFLFSPLPHIRSDIPVMIAFIITIYHSIQNEDDDDEEEDLLPDNR